MTFDMTVLRPILREREEKINVKEIEADTRRAEIYAKVPRIREIDIELRKTPLEIVRATFNDKNKAEELLRATRAKNLSLQAEREKCLVEAGFSKDALEVKYDCGICKDTGYVSAGEPCECLAREYRAALIKKIAHEFSVSENTFDAFDLELYNKRNGSPSQYDIMKSIFNYCVNYAKHFGDKSDNVFFTGGTGLGKTFLASCIAVEVAALGNSVAYTTAFDAVRAMEERRFMQGEDKFEKLRNRDLLVIDDLGDEHINSFSIATLYNLITTRMTANKKTILISKFSVDEIGSKYSEQLASRLNGEYITLSFTGEDIRGKKRK